jgi:hypothetical protein
MSGVVFALGRHTKANGSNAHSKKDALMLG